MSPIGTSTNDLATIHPTSTVGGAYLDMSTGQVLTCNILPRDIDADDEARQWAEASRRSLGRWAKQNPW